VLNSARDANGNVNLRRHSLSGASDLPFHR
jgi:hypothetical protein